MNPIRHAQTAARIQERLATIFAFELKDPRAGFLTVTRVKLARDLTQCTVYYSVLGDEKDRALVAKMLEHARGFLQRQLGRSIRTRVLPRLFFQFDPSIEGAIRLSKRIDEVVAADARGTAALDREAAPEPADDAEAGPEERDEPIRPAPDD